MRNGVRGCRGHNLLEMIIACFIFTTVAVGLTAVWIQHSKAMEFAGSRLVGQFLANQLMEECIAAGYDTVDELGGPRPDFVMNEIVRSENKTVIYQATITIVPMDGASGHPIAPIATTGSPTDPFPKEVTVKVEWDQQNGKGEIEYKSVLASNGAP